MKQHKILLLDHVSHTIFASDILKTRFKEPCLLWQFVCPYICCNSFPTSRMSRTGGVCNDCVPIGWKLEVTLPLGRAGEVTERLKRTQSIWTLQTDRPKPKSQLYHLQARELPSNWAGLRPSKCSSFFTWEWNRASSFSPSSWSMSPISM